MTTSTLAADREAYAELLDATLSGLPRQLAVLGGVSAAYLCGSAARGRRDLLTDIDLVVVMNSDEPFVERCARMRLALVLPVDADVMVYTPEEFARMREERFLTHALSGAVTIYKA